MLPAVYDDSALSMTQLLVQSDSLSDQSNAADELLLGSVDEQTKDFIATLTQECNDETKALLAISARPNQIGSHKTRETKIQARIMVAAARFTFIQVVNDAAAPT